MIVIETSALVALREIEPEAERMRQVLSRSDRLYVPASALAEFALLRKLGGGRLDWLQRFLAELDVQIAAIDSSVAWLASTAAGRYGRGSGHQARLNFGDCLSYAVAKHLGAPLLYKGDDFIHTDIESALSP